MGDAVSWTALGVTIPTVIALVGMGVAYGRLSGKVNNGLTKSFADFREEVKESRQEVKDNFKTLWKKLDELPCRQPHCPEADEE